MRKRTFLIFVGYIWAKTLYGLVFHPYRSVQEVTRHQVLLPVVLSPFYGLLTLFIIGRVGSILLETHGLIKTLIAIILSTALISIFVWQILLLYLLLSFLLKTSTRNIGQ